MEGYQRISAVFKKWPFEKPGVVAHTCNPSTQEAEAEGSHVQGQLEVHKETLSKKNNT
jgi:hypothetical protein